MITYHIATIDDMHEIQTFLREIWSTADNDTHSTEELRTMNLQRHSSELLTEQIQSKDVYFGVAKDQDKIIGMCNAVLTHDRTIIHIQRLHVLPSYERQGIGSQFITEATRTFPTAVGIDLEMERQNKKAYAFYKKHGFREAGIRTLEISGTHVPYIIMEKVL